MKKRTTWISLWLASGACAFGLGWTLKPKAPEPTETSETRRPLTSLRGAASSNDPGAAKSASESLGAELAATGFGPAPNELAKYFGAGGSISPEQMTTAMKDMRRENDPLKRRAMFAQLLDQLTPENAKSAYLALREGGGGRGRRGPWDGGEEARLVLNAWGRLDGAAAVAELEAMAEAQRQEREANGETGDRGGRGWGDRGGGFDIASVLSGWATSDATSAMDYVNGVEDERQKGWLTGSLISGLMVNGVDEAVSFISTLPEEDENRGRHMWRVAEEVLEDGVTEAAQWVTNLSDDSLKEGAMRRIADSYSRENLQDAIAWVSEHGDSEYAHGAVTEVAERWAESDPQATIEWASTLPEEAQRGAFMEALDEWTEKDAVAASEYLPGMPDSAVKDSAIQGFSTELVRDDPQSAATWAATINDEALRGETLERIGREWYRSDRTAAEEWLATSGLSEEQQQQVKERRDWRRGR